MHREPAYLYLMIGYARYGRLRRCHAGLSSGSLAEPRRGSHRHHVRGDDDRPVCVHRDQQRTRRPSVRAAAHKCKIAAIFPMWGEWPEIRSRTIA